MKYNLSSSQEGAKHLVAATPIVPMRLRHELHQGVVTTERLYVNGYIESGIADVLRYVPASDASIYGSTATEKLEAKRQAQVKALSTEVKNLKLRLAQYEKVNADKGAPR